MKFWLYAVRTTKPLISNKHFHATQLYILYYHVPPECVINRRFYVYEAQVHALLHATTYSL